MKNGSLDAIRDPFKKLMAEGIMRTFTVHDEKERIIDDGFDGYFDELKYWNTESTVCASCGYKGKKKRSAYKVLIYAVPRSGIGSVIEGGLCRTCDAIVPEGKFGLILFDFDSM